MRWDFCAEQTESAQEAEKPEKKKKVEKEAKKPGKKLIGKRSVARSNYAKF